MKLREQINKILQEDWYVNADGKLATKKYKTIDDFIMENQDKIDEIIKKKCKNCFNNFFHNQQRRQWILNDEELHSWAEVEGVDFNS